MKWELVLVYSQPLSTASCTTFAHRFLDFQGISFGHVLHFPPGPTAVLKGTKKASH